MYIDNFNNANHLIIQSISRKNDGLITVNSSNKWFHERIAVVLLFSKLISRKNKCFNAMQMISRKKLLNDWKTVWNVAGFSIIRILREPNFGEYISSKSNYCHFQCSEFCSFGKSQASNSAKYHKDQDSDLLNV